MITNALNNTPALSVAVRRTIMDANTKGVTVVHDRLPLQLVYIMANFRNLNDYKKKFWNVEDKKQLEKNLSAILKQEKKGKSKETKTKETKKKTRKETKKAKVQEAEWIFEVYIGYMPYTTIIFLDGRHVKKVASWAQRVSAHSQWVQ